MEFVDLRRPGETERGKLRGQHTGMRGFPRVEALAHGAVGIERPQPGALRAGETERPRRLLFVQAHEGCACRGGAERPAHAGQVPAAQPRRGGIERKAGADHDFVSGGDRSHEPFTARAELFSHGDCGRNHDRAGMKLGLVIVVELESMARRAIYESCIGRAQPGRRFAPDGRGTLCWSAGSRPVEEHFRPRRRVAIDAGAQCIQQEDANDFSRSCRELAVG